MCSACFLYRTEILNSIQVDGSPVRNVRRVDEGNRSKSDSDFEASHSQSGKERVDWAYHTHFYPSKSIKSNDNRPMSDGTSFNYRLTGK